MLKDVHSDLLDAYRAIYRGSAWGEADGKYYRRIQDTFQSVAKKVGMPTRIPLRLFKDVIDETDLVVVLLDHIDYLLKMRGETSPYGFAAYSISRLKQPLTSLSLSLQSIKGVGRTAEKVIEEILRTGSSATYEKLMNV